jgi:hypothetical protein
MFLKGEPWELTEVETQVFGHEIGVPDVLQTPEILASQELGGASRRSQVVVRQNANA